MSLRELILLMDACGADYGNWGICVLGDCLWLGDDNDGEVLSVPLIDVVTYADEHFSDYGHEEVFLVFDFGRNGTAIEWELYTSVHSKH